MPSGFPCSITPAVLMAASMARFWSKPFFIALL
jgi:hypothetical protein